MVFTSIEWTPTRREKDHHIVELFYSSKKYRHILSNLMCMHGFGNRILKDKGDKIHFRFENENYLVKKNFNDDFDDFEIYTYKLNEDKIKKQLVRG